MKEGIQRKKSLKALRRKEKASKQGKRAARAKKQIHRVREGDSLTPRQARKFSLLAAGAIAAVAGATWAILALTPNLPPTEISGHTENVPPGHILSTHMPELVQRHMLEHADGKGTPHAGARRREGPARGDRAV